MKRKIILFLSVITSVLFVSCQNIQVVNTEKINTEEVNNKDIHAEEENVEEVTSEENNAKEMDEKSSITLVFEDKSKTIEDEKGNLILTVTSNLPVITIEGNEQASKKINDYYEEKQKKHEEEIKEYVKYATDNYALLEIDQLEYWNGYGLGETYEKARVDESIISIINESYEYAGGAHPNTVRNAQNFDTQTGQLLALKDVLTDENQGIIFINDFLREKIKEEGVEGGFFEDYESNLKDVLTDSTWYLSDEGFVIIVNVYIVSPYAAGIREFTIPYEDFPYLVEKYQTK